MKVFRSTLTVVALVALLSSCNAWSRMFPPKYGCGTDGKNVGAEKINDAINSGEKIKAKKFKA